MQQGERSSRSNKQASAKKAKKLSQQDKASPVTKEKRIFRASSFMSSSAFSPPKDSGEWGYEDSPVFKPRRGNMKSLEHHQDDRRMNDEWADDGEKREREVRDKRIERGGSPGPKEKHGASSWTSSRTREGQMWGRVMGEDTMSFDAQEPKDDDEHSCEDGPDRKFRGKDKRKEA